MDRVIKSMAVAIFTALTIGTTIDALTTPAEAHYYRGGHHRGHNGRRGVGVGIGIAAGALVAGTAAAALGSYDNPYYGGYGYYGLPYIGYPRSGDPGYGYYGYGH